MNPWRHLLWPLVASLGLAAWGDLARADEGCELGAFGCEHEQNLRRMGRPATTGRTAVRCGRGRMMMGIGDLAAAETRRSAYADRMSREHYEST